MAQSYFTIEILVENSTKVPAKLVKINKSDTILQAVTSQWSTDLTIHKVFIGDTDVSEELATTFEDIESLQLGNKIRVLYCAKEEVDLTKADNEPKSAFDVLRQASRANDYMPPEKPENNQKDRLYNDIIKFLQNERVGFPRSNTSLGTFVLRELCEVFWYLDPMIPILEDRHCYLPSSLKLTGYVNYKVQKKKKPMLMYRDLSYNIEKIQQIVMLPWLGQFEKLKDLLYEMCAKLEKVAADMKQQQERTRMNHQSEVPVRSLKASWDIKTIAIGQTSLESQRLKQDLEKSSVYQLVSLQEYLPSDLSPKVYINSLTFKFPVRLFTYSFGNYLGNIYFLWRTDDEKDDQREMSAVKQILDDIPKYSTRAMRRQFLNRYTQVTKPYLLRDMYRFLTNDESAPENEAEQSCDIQVFEFLCGTDDADLVMDYRKYNGPKQSKFEIFWGALEKILERMAIVNERRTDENMYMPDFLSVRDLRDEVMKECPPETPAPSIPWLRFQFQPTNPYIRTAAKYTSKFPIKYKVQQRLLRHTHPDSKYCAILYQYLKSFCIEFREDCHMICVDDKAIVPVGTYNLPVGTNVRRHGGSLVSHDAPLYASDHDYHLAGIVPSVVLNVEIPEHKEDSFHRGILCVVLKDKVFSPSNPMRHSAETTKILRRETDIQFDIPVDDEAEDGIQSLDSDTARSIDFACPILVLYSDGGPDHNTTFMAVKIAAIALFISLNLDFYVAARCAPMQSYSNPAERCMSVLNIALQSCALSRDEMPDFELEMKRHSSISSLRNQAKSRPSLKVAFQRAMQTPLRVLQQRFQRLVYSGKKVASFFEASPEEMSAMGESLAIFVDGSEVDVDMMKKKPQNFPKLQDFMEKHLRARQYILQIKKCTDPECWYCSLLAPIRMSEEEFKQVHWIPDPMPKDDGWMSFEEVYGEETTDSFRPSLKSKPVCAADVDNKAKFVAGRIRGFVICSECSKRRCVYAIKSFDKVTFRAYQRIKDDQIYTCGDKLFHEGEELEKEVVVREALTCSTPIEVLYYSAPARATDTAFICCLCGNTDNLLDGSHAGLRVLQTQYATVRPICKACWESGKRPMTRNQVKTK